jgi:exosortase/archaeosortase family protein
MAEGSALHYLRTNGLVFLGIFVALYAVYSFSLPVLEHYFAWLAQAVCWSLSPFDPAISCAGNVILYRGSPSLRVVEGCDGITVFILIVAAVLAFNRPLMARLVGIAICIPVLFLINLGRLLILSSIRFYLPDHFGWVHVYLFQPVMIFATFACFVIWVVFSE